MKETPNEILKHLDNRLDQIEKLITLSLINDFLPQYTGELYNNLSDEIKDQFERSGYFITKSEVFSNKIAIYLRTEMKTGIKEMREMTRLISNHSNNLILVFELEKATILQKKKCVEEKISYYIKDKELFIAINQEA